MSPKASVCSAAFYAEAIKLKVYDKSPMNNNVTLDLYKVNAATRTSGAHRQLSPG
jgi:hypothetical protein